MNEKRTLAVCLHLYYTEQLDTILRRLENLGGVDYDLFVTMTAENPAAEAKIKSFNPGARILHTENRGYDIGPFIECLHSINLDSYKYILKIHAKRTGHGNYTHLNDMRFDDSLWCEVLWDALLASAAQVRKNLHILSEPQTGMLSSKYCVNSERRNFEVLMPQINILLGKIYGTGTFAEPGDLEFVAGSMFYVKAELLKPLLKLYITDFAPTDGHIKEGTLAHAAERIFGIIIKKQGYKIAGVYGRLHWHPRLAALAAEVRRFFYQRKITKSGKLLVKICKIPVYSRRIAA